MYLYDTAGRMTLGKNLENGTESAYTYNALRMCVKNTQKLSAADGLTSRETEYVPDFLSMTNNELMAYETEAGATRTVFGHRYHRLYQNTPSGRTYFQSDIYGSPIFAADGQGTLKQYAERDIWGTLKPGTDILSGLEENMRFTTYRFDPVIGKHFALARFYNGANGRMMSKDPVKRGLNQYCYCDNDPVNYEDSTGEVLHILGASLLGGVLGGGGAALDSIASQVFDGEKIDWKEVKGSAIEGSINGATQGGLLASGVGIPALLFGDFLGGAAGSAAKQYYLDGNVDVKESITRGLTNAVGNALYGNGKLKGVKDALRRGARTGAAESAINYISDHIGTNPAQVRMGTGVLPAVDINLLPDGLLSDPKRGCGGESSFAPGLGYSSARGYRYKTPDISESKSNQCSIGGFLKETALGGLMGGLSSAAFYKADKAIDKLIDSVLPKKRGKGKKEEVRYREGRAIEPMEITYDMRLNPEEYAYAVADKYGINLRGSKQKINIKYDPNHKKGPGVSRKNDPTNIILGQQAFINEEELARTISHELNHARSWLKGGCAPEDTARAAEDALGAFINGGR